MKKLVVAVILFVFGLVGTAVWFSPLCAFGKPQVYNDNRAEYTINGVCYPADSVCRVDFAGDETAMFTALTAMRAQTVKTAESGGALIVYAYSDRVCVKPLKTSDGIGYNVMAAVRDGVVSIGTPLISGSY